jgi:hypothetical protein
MEKFINQMAKTVIGLHEDGYDYDFEQHGSDQLWGVQENRPYTFSEININKICLIKACNGRPEKIILAIETTDGCKGLFIQSNMNGFIKEGLNKNQLS